VELGSLLEVHNNAPGWGFVVKANDAAHGHGTCLHEEDDPNVRLMVIVSFATQKLASRIAQLNERHVADRAEVEAVLAAERAALQDLTPVPAHMRDRLDVLTSALARAFDEAVDDITIDRTSGGQSWAQGGCRQRVQTVDTAVVGVEGCDGGAYHPPHQMKADQQLSPQAARLLVCAAPLCAAAMAAVDACAPHTRMVLEDVLGSGAVGNTFTYPPAHLQVCMPPLPHHTFQPFHSQFQRIEALGCLHPPPEAASTKPSSGEFDLSPSLFSSHGTDRHRTTRPRPCRSSAWSCAARAAVPITMCTAWLGCTATKRTSRRQASA
tara:strand:- start:104 stop:1072 length:969 start_codon:yes stop_codon:yes gene_type:complete